MKYLLLTALHMPDIALNPLISKPDSLDRDSIGVAGGVVGVGDPFTALGGDVDAVDIEVPAMASETVSVCSEGCIC